MNTRHAELSRVTPKHKWPYVEQLQVTPARKNGPRGQKTDLSVYLGVALIIQQLQTCNLTNIVALLSFPQPSPTGKENAKMTTDHLFFIV